MPSPCFLRPLRGDGTAGRGVLCFLFIASRASCFRAIVPYAFFVERGLFLRAFFVLNFAGKE